MKLKGHYQIHALIGRCHLHNKKNALYSITLKMGSKAVANTQYKMPTNDEINFNTELILKIDKALFEGPGKLSIIVTMQTEEKEKKIIGSAFANFKQRGLQSFRVSQCSCRDKGIEVNVEFEVVNIQNHNNNPDNNKFQSPNNSQMKDLKKALTISRQKQLIKSSRAKQSTGTKSPAQKTQPKLNKHKIQKQLKDQLSPDLINLTTKISPHSLKTNQQTKQIVSQLKDKITMLEGSLRQGLASEKTTRMQVNMLQNEVDILRRENECLVQILTFEQEKSSAAIQYISFLVEKIGQKNLMNHQFNQYFELITTIKNNQQSDSSSTIKHLIQSQPQHKQSPLSYKMNSIEEKQQIVQENTQRLIEELQLYKITLMQLRQQITHYENDQIAKNQHIANLEIETRKIETQNISLKTQIETLKTSLQDYDLQLESLTLQNTSLNTNINKVQKLVAQINLKNKQLHSQTQQLSKRYNININQNTHLKQIISDLKQNIQQHHKQYSQLQLQCQRYKTREKPPTPFQSQIILKKSKFDDGEDIQNIIQEMNHCIQANQHQLLIASNLAENQSEQFLSRNKSQSLLKDLQQSQPQSPKTSQTSYKSRHQHKDQMTTKSSKKVSIPEHKKQVQKYNYEYDIDSLNYFNNFEQNHERMETSGVEESNSCEIQLDLQGKA